MKSLHKEGDSIGTINWLDKDNEMIKKYLIRKGRLSISPKEDFFLLNFWMLSGYYEEQDNGCKAVVGGPFLEILTKIGELTNSMNLNIPSREEAKNEWNINYASHYYFAFHTEMNEANVKIDKIGENIYSVKFSGKPAEDDRQFRIAGECELILSQRLETYW